MYKMHIRLSKSQISCIMVFTFDVGLQILTFVTNAIVLYIFLVTAEMLYAN